VTPLVAIGWRRSADARGYILPCILEAVPQDRQGQQSAIALH
jgi:hypothetical protein